MEGVARVRYSKEETPIEGNVSYTLKQTITQGLNNGGVLVFQIPPSPDCFTDLSSTLLKLEMMVRRMDGVDMAAEEVVCLDAGGMHSLFSSCEVRFNDRMVSCMTSYPFITQLSRYLGGTTELGIS